MADADDVTLCVDAAYSHYVKRMGKPPGPMLEDYRQIIRDNQVFVAVTDKVAGLIVTMQTATGILLDNVAVLPEYQGQGIGKHLIEHAELEAAKSGADAIRLYTHILMTENIAMYKSLGYVETERKQVSGYDRIYFEKRF